MTEQYLNLTNAVTRLARSMALTQASLAQGPPAALLTSMLPSLRASLDAVEAALAGVPRDHLIDMPTNVIGPNTAKLIADAVGVRIPDTVPEDWK